MSAASRKSPRDHTGRKAAELAEKHAKELAERAGEISTINDLPEVVDGEETEIVVTSNVEVKAAMKKLQVNTDLEDVVIGQGNVFTFKRGKTYSVPSWVYDHLEEKGYVWH